MEEYKKFISGESIMKLWQVDASRIFDLFPDGGLQPYKPTGREFRPPAEFHSYSLLMKRHALLLNRWNEDRKQIEIIKKHAEVLGDELLKQQSDHFEQLGEQMRQELESIWEEAQSIKKQDPELRLWKYFEKDAVDDDKLQELVDQVRHCLFELDQAIKFFPVDDLDDESKRNVLLGHYASPQAQIQQSNEHIKSQVEKPAFVFYKSGDVWRIGPIGSERLFKALKGFDYIHFLLQYRNKSVPALIVRSLGKSGVGLEDITPHQISELSRTVGMNEYARPEKECDPQTQERLQKAINRLKKKLKHETDTQTKRELTNQINDFEKYLRDANRTKHSPEAEAARKIVQKHIQKAIEKIREEFKSAPALIEELGRVRTGFACCYDGRANWQLHQQN